ncbi:4'-phosphopantetheinyl transferase superfamily protein [Bradyrhizobium sp. Leaf401]|uniref:4'-phosphopantetheinyl transferase family protein n=1 Tax=Bradyrhizobium sp. Leaf401 TaxID=2876564 RepID=UPI001E4D1347|nr:4'-phosphopantetheinyl transferase superfamily protein [Bradyrhizobium sp. Leaf401]
MSSFDISSDLEDMYIQCLNESERVRFKSLALPTFRRQYLMSRVMVRMTLSRYADVSPIEWEFRSNSYGRPFISKPILYRDLDFNLSHTNGLIACAVARGARHIGVDVEDLQRTIDPKSLADFVFAPKEIDAVRAADFNEQRALFFSYWTLKEAYIKAMGLGLSIPLDSFWFDLSAPRPRVNFSIESADDPAQWQFHHRKITERHRIAVAVSIPSTEQVRLAFRWTTPAKHNA